MNNSNDNVSEYYTDEEDTQYYRLSIENSSKIRNDIYKLKTYHTKQIRRLENSELESVKNIDTYIRTKLVPSISIKNDETNSPYLSINSTEIKLEEKSEIGTNLIIDVTNDKNFKIIGQSDSFYEATIMRPRMKAYRMRKRIQKDKPKIQKRKEFKISSKIIGDLNSNYHIMRNRRRILGTKRRRRQKRRYIKQSTVIEIKKLNN